MKKPSVARVVLFTDEIMTYFHEKVKGLASDYAYYELLQYVEDYLADPQANRAKLVENLQWTFGIDSKALLKIEKEYQRRAKDICEVVWNMR